MRRWLTTMFGTLLAVGLIAVAAITIIGTVGTNVVGVFTKASGELAKVPQ